MKSIIFRPAAFWKSAVMTMPDNSFFELMRSVFGKIKTPFNKQQLLNDLEAFLLRNDIQKTIAAYIDETDSKIIMAASLFGEPVPGQLADFFHDEFSYAQLQDAIVNLEERFILYRFTNEKITRLALNPVLKSILLPITKNTASLFPAASAGKASQAVRRGKAGQTAINDLTLAALFSFVSKRESFYKSEGVIRKKVIDDSKILFPGINLESLLGALQVLGLFYINEDRLTPDNRYINDFVLLSSRGRMEYCAAALMIYSALTPPLEILPPLFKNKIREITNFIHCFLDSLKEEIQYPKETLRKKAEVLKAQMNMTESIRTESLFDALEKTGLISGTAAGLMQSGAIAENITDTGSPVIAIDSGSSILVYPEIKFADAVRLASFLYIRETSPAQGCTVIRFELDKECAIRSFDNGISADEITELLIQLSGGKTDDTLIWNLNDWEKRHREVSLKKGVILQLAEDRRYLTETDSLARLITETLAPGLYLLNENTMDEAEAVLRSAGIDIIARKKERKENVFASGSYFPAPSLTVQPGADIPSVTAANPVSGTKPLSLTTDFQAILQTMALSETERAELSARIERRLVLCEAQLRDANIRYEKLEAKRMDYSGKQNIAKQAISQQSPVEVSWQVKNKEKKIYGIPQALEKEGNELILVILPDHKDTGTEFLRIPLAKISLLRRIKKSIFER